MSGRCCTQHKQKLHQLSPGAAASSISVSAAGLALGDYANKIPNYQIAITVQVLLAPDSSITTSLTTLISVSCEKTL